MAATLTPVLKCVITNHTETVSTHTSSTENEGETQICNEKEGEKKGEGGTEAQD